MIIPTNRRIDWSNAGVTGGIPDTSGWHVSSTHSPGVSLATLNAALATAAAAASSVSPQVVVLNAGSYSFGGAIDFGQCEYVLLRGAGRTSTNITFTPHGGGANCVIGEQTINRIAPPAGQIKNWTAGFTQGTTTITLSSATGVPAVGHLLVLDQVNDGVEVDNNIQEGCDYCGRIAGGRSMAQYVRIVAKSGNDITIEPGLYMPLWSLSLTPQVFYWTEDDTKFCGIEDLSMTSNVNSGLYCVSINQAQNCWVKDCNFYTTPQACIATSQCKNIEVRKISVLSNQGAGNLSYGVVPYMVSDMLVVDSIFDQITGAVVLGPQANGCVVAYNVFPESIYEPTNWDIASLSIHDTHVCMNLFEGNWANKTFVDSIHGSNSRNTWLRNYFHGHTVTHPTSNNTMAFDAQQWCRYNNLIGNLLGTPGYHDFYLVDTLAEWVAHSTTSIYVLGDGNAGDGTPFDTTVAATTAIHGNYDTFTDGQVWETTNTNVADFTDHDIPDSYFLPSKPDWFFGLTWPPYDPATPGVTGLDATPAGYRYLNGGANPPASDSAGTLNATTANITTLTVGA